MPCGASKLREEVWQDSAGKIVRYNLAFINHFIYRGDTDVFLVTTWRMGIITGTLWGSRRDRFSWLREAVKAILPRSRCIA